MINVTRDGHDEWDFVLYRLGDPFPDASCNLAALRETEARTLRRCRFRNGGQYRQQLSVAIGIASSKWKRTLQLIGGVLHRNCERLRWRQSLAAQDCSFESSSEARAIKVVGNPIWYDNLFSPRLGPHAPDSD